MTKKIILLSALCVFFCAPAYASLAYPIKPTVKEVMVDKTGKKYQFRETYDINHGLATYDYDFGRNGKYQLVYSGETFYEDETCPDPKEETKLDKAIIKHTYIRKDINGDGIDDITLKVTEQNCETGEKTEIKRQILSTKTGFEVKKSQHKE